MKKIKEDPNSVADNQTAAQTALQKDAMTGLIDGQSAIAPWKPMKANLDDKGASKVSRPATKVDAKTNPAQGWVRHPDMPKPLPVK
jgi:hypothetical protein